jgi:hypothetical protein
MANRIAALKPGLAWLGLKWRAQKRRAARMSRSSR